MSIFLMILFIPTVVFAKDNVMFSFSISDIDIGESKKNEMEVLRLILWNLHIMESSM